MSPNTSTLESALQAQISNRTIAYAIEDALSSYVWDSINDEAFDARKAIVLFTRVRRITSGLTYGPFVAIHRIACRVLEMDVCTQADVCDACDDLKSTLASLFAGLR